MKIIEQTDSLFVLQKGQIGAIIFGGILVILFAYLMFRFWGTNKFWLILVFMVGALAIILFSYTLTVSFNKSSGEMSIIRTGIIFNSVEKYQIQNIVEVKDKEFLGTSTLSLTMKDGSNIFIYSKKSGGFSNLGFTSIAEALAKFLNIPLNAR